MKLRLLIGLIFMILGGTVTAAESSSSIDRDDLDTTLSNPLFIYSQEEYRTIIRPELYECQKKEAEGRDTLYLRYRDDLKTAEESSIILCGLMNVFINFPVWIETGLTCAIMATEGTICTLNACNSKVPEFHPRACEIQQEADKYVYLAGFFMIIWGIHSFYDWWYPAQRN